MTEPQIGGTYEELLEIALWAERSGLVSFARSDHYLHHHEPTFPATDAFATLAGLARDTSTIKLCVLVSPITFRHPAVIAKNAVTIDQMSGGRLELGVGTGWMNAEHEAFGLPFPARGERFERLDETLQYLRAAFYDQPSRFAGAYYSLDATLLPKPAGTLPIIVGGSGPKKTPTLAGKCAEEFNFFIQPPEAFTERVSLARRVAESAGRPAPSISVMGPLLVGTDQADYRERLQAIAAKKGATVEEVEQRWRETGAPMGTPAQAEEAFAALEEAGVSRYYVQDIRTPDLDKIKRMVEPILG